MKNASHKLSSPVGIADRTVSPTGSIGPWSWALALGLTGALLTGCTETDEDNAPFTIKTLSQSVASNAVLAVTDRYLAFPASELGTGSGGTDFNMDGDVSDDVLTVVVLGNDQVIRLNTALKPGANPASLLWANEVLFMVVSESADGRDWNADMDTSDDVLLYWHFNLPSPVYYATLADDEIYLVNGDVLYTPVATLSAVGDTNIARIDVPTTGAAPSAPEALTTSFTDPGGDGLELRLRGSANGVAWMTASEVDEGADLNGDADALDTAVLALFGTGSGNQIQMVGQAVAGSDPEIEVIVSGTQRIVAYFVDEASQGANLNDPSLFPGLWQASQCSAVDDVDTLDSVLHWLNLTDFTLDPVGDAPHNTGLVGDRQIYSLGDTWLGVVTQESDEGSGGGCDLNQDGDTSDNIFRWIEITTTSVPENDSTRLVAIQTSIAGGTDGIVPLDNRLWVALVDEAADGRDYDGTVADIQLLGVIDPALTSTPWNFDMGSNTFIQVSWMAPDETTASRFFAAITEASLMVDRNADGDMTDSIPTFPVEGGALRELDFPGISVAVETNNAGMLTRSGFGFYRISEAAQEFDYNLDGDLNDKILARVSLSGASPATSMGVVQNTARSVVQVGSGSNPRGIVWMAPEPLEGPAGSDLNGDGDANDIALRYARLP